MRYLIVALVLIQGHLVFNFGPQRYWQFANAPKIQRSSSGEDLSLLKCFYKIKDTSILEYIKSDSFLLDWEKVTYSSLLNEFSRSNNGNTLLDTVNMQYIYSELDQYRRFKDSNWVYRESRGDFLKEVLISRVTITNPYLIKLIEVTGEDTPVFYLYMECANLSYLERYEYTVHGWLRKKEKI